MKMCKFLAAAAALVMALSLTTTVFATDVEGTSTDTVIQNVNPNGTEITIGTVLNLPTIKVTIGTPVNVIINPYKMAYTVSTPVALSGNDSLISAPVKIKSNSTVGIKFSATPSVTVNSGIEVAEQTTNNQTDKNKKAVYIALAMKTVNSDTDVASFYGTEDGVQTAVAKKTGASDTLNTKEITIEKAASSGDGDAKYAAYRIIGDSCGTDWTTEDSITLKVVFGINPVIGS